MPIHNKRPFIKSAETLEDHLRSKQTSILMEGKLPSIIWSDSVKKARSCNRLAPISAIYKKQVYDQAIVPITGKNKEKLWNSILRDRWVDHTFVAHVCRYSINDVQYAEFSFARRLERDHFVDQLYRS